MARNVGSRYLAIGVNALIGLLLMPFNESHLGQAAYGLWALTTSIPITIAAVLLQFPVACARVGVSAWTVVCRQAVWPAVWPVAGLLAVVWGGRPFVPPSLTGLGALLVVAGLAYVALFAGCALPSAERRVYWSKLLQLAGCASRTQSVAA